MLTPLHIWIENLYLRTAVAWPCEVWSGSRMPVFNSFKAKSLIVPVQVIKCFCIAMFLIKCPLALIFPLQSSWQFTSFIQFLEIEGRKNSGVGGTKRTLFKPQFGSLTRWSTGTSFRFPKCFVLNYLVYTYCQERSGFSTDFSRILIYRFSNKNKFSKVVYTTKRMKRRLPVPKGLVIEKETHTNQ